MTTEISVQLLKLAWIAENSGELHVSSVLRDAHDEIFDLRKEVQHGRNQIAKLRGQKSRQLKRADRLERLIKSVALDLQNGLPEDRASYLLRKTIEEFKYEDKPPPDQRSEDQ